MPSAPAALNLLAKGALVGLLVFAVLRPNLPQFAGKAMETRLLTFGLSAVVLPVAWALSPGLRRAGTYPHVTDALIVAPFLLDTVGNALNLYDGVVWFDDVMHFATWLPWVVAFGLLLTMRRRFPAGRTSVWCSASVRSRTSSGSSPSTSPSSATAPSWRAPTPTRSDDLLLSLIGALAGALLSATALWSLGRRHAARRP